MAADRYLFRSLNGGTAWKELDVRIDGQTSYIQAILLDPDNDQRIYMARGDGVFTSADGGDSWTALNKGLSAPNAQCLALNPAKAYLFTGTSGGGLFRNLVTSLK